MGQLTKDEVFALAMQRYSDAVYRAAYHNCSCAADAEDVVQDVFEKLLNYDGRFESEEHHYLLTYNRTDRKFETILQEEVNGNTSQGIRGIYIEDTLYVISGNIIEAYDMNTGVKSGDIIL